MAQYVVKKEYEETVRGVRTYKVNADSVSEAWSIVLSGLGVLESETADVEKSDWDMISAFIVEP